MARERQRGPFRLPPCVARWPQTRAALRAASFERRRAQATVQVARNLQSWALRATRTARRPMSLCERNAGALGSSRLRCVDARRAWARGCRRGDANHDAVRATARRLPARARAHDTSDPAERNRGRRSLRVRTWSPTPAERADCRSRPKISAPRAVRARSGRLLTFKRAGARARGFLLPVHARARVLVAGAREGRQSAAF